MPAFTSSPLPLPDVCTRMGGGHCALRVAISEEAAAAAVVAMMQSRERGRYDSDNLRSLL